MDTPDPWAETNSSELRKKTIPLGGAKQAILEAQEELQSALRLLDEGIGQVNEEHRLRKFPTSVHEVIHAGRRLIYELQSDVAPTRTWGKDAQDAIDHFNSVMRFYESNPELTIEKERKENIKKFGEIADRLFGSMNWDQDFENKNTTLPTKQEIDQQFAGTNFGGSTNEEMLINCLTNTILGYSSGSTILGIATNLKLIRPIEGSGGLFSLTQRGLKYLLISQ